MLGQQAQSGWVFSPSCMHTDMHTDMPPVTHREFHALTKRCQAMTAEHTRTPLTSAPRTCSAVSPALDGGEALHSHAFPHRCLAPALLYEKSNPFSSLISIAYLILAKQLCNGTGLHWS